MIPKWCNYVAMWLVISIIHVLYFTVIYKIWLHRLTLEIVESTFVCCYEPLRNATTVLYLGPVPHLLEGVTVTV